MEQFERQQRHKSKSFHYVEDPNSYTPRRSRRDRSLERRRSLEDNDSLERRPGHSRNHSYGDEFLSLEQQQMMMQQMQQRRTVIHACDDKTGKCLFHPHITLRKKALFGMLGGWVDVLRNCPECEHEDVKRLNSEGAVGAMNAAMNKCPPLQKERRRRRTLSPIDRRDRTLSPNPNRRATTESDKNRRADRTLSPKKRDRTLSPLDRSKREVSPRKRDRTLSPIDKRRGRDRTLSPIDKRPERNERRGRREYYHAPPPLKPTPKQRSRTLSPIDRSRKRLGAFKKKKDADDDASVSDEEDKRKQSRKNWRTRTTTKRYEDDEHNHSYADEIKKKKKKAALRGRRRRESNDVAPPPNPNDFISSYLTTGSVPDSRARTKRRGSLGGLKDSGNSVSEWKNLSANVASDVAEKGMKLAEKMMRKKNRKKVTRSTNTWEGHSDDEKMDYLKQNFIYDVDVDEKDDSFEIHTKSQDEMFMYSKDEYSKSQPEIMQTSKSSRRRNRKVDLSDRTGDTDMNMSWQTPRRKEEEVVPQSPRRKEAEHVYDAPKSPRQKGKSSQDKYSYEKSWSADGIRVRAESANDDDYDRYDKALSMDGGIHVVASDDVEGAQSSQFGNEPEQQPQAVDGGGGIWSYSNESNTPVEHQHFTQESGKQVTDQSKSSAAQFTSFTEQVNLANDSRDMNSSGTFNMDKLKSVMQEYIAKRPSANIAEEDTSPQPDAAVMEPDELYNDTPQNADNEQKSTELEQKDDTSQSEDESPAPFPTKSEALPRVMSLGNLTIDLSALQASRPAKPGIKSVEKKSAAAPSGNSIGDNSSASESEQSIKIDRSTLQRARPKKDPDEETVRTFATTNLPWTGRFGESGMYTGLVNEQYQPHGRGTMMYDHGEIKKGHWKYGDFVRESGPYSDSEDDDSDDDEKEADLSSSMMDFNTNVRSRSRSRDRVELQPPPLSAPTYKIGETAKHSDMIQEIDVIKESIPSLDVGDGAFIRRSDGNWTYAEVKVIEAVESNRAIRFTVNEKNSSKSYAEKYWFTHIRPMKVTPQQNDFESKKCDPAGIISRQSSVPLKSENDEESDNRSAATNTYCPPVQSRLFGARGRSRSRSRRRCASLTPMRTLCSIDESDMEDEDSDEENDDSFSGNNTVEVTGLHSIARTTYALRGIDP